MKPFNKVENTRGKSLFIFEHGLGDLINFLPVFKEFCEQTHRRVSLGTSPKRQFKHIYKNIIEIADFTHLRYQFNYVYKIMYPDPKNTSIPISISEEPAKPYICAYYELGMEEFTWKPYRMLNKWKLKNSNRVGVHLFGHTGMDKKFCPVDVAEQIWQEIVDAGYKPYEIHMTPEFASDYPDFVEADHIDCINRTCSLRYSKPDLLRMIQETGKCKFFIGVDSGPIYLASALLGIDYLIGLENQKRHNNFLPKHIVTVPVNEYKSGTIYKQLKLKEEWL